MRRVLVIGDAISDVYRECSFKKMCPEEPKAPAVVESFRECKPGGAANVAVNLAALSPGTKVDLIAVLDDELARSVKFSSRSLVSMDRCVIDRALVKERILIGREIVCRVDNSSRVSGYASERIAASVRAYFAEHDPDLILLSDYGGWTLNADPVEKLLDRRDRLIIDTKDEDLSRYAGSLGCKLNESEHQRVLRWDHSPERHFRYFILTKGRAGADIISRTGDERRSTTHRIEIAGHNVPALDVNGCGDTFLAGFAAGILRYNDPVAAAELANAAAADVVRIKGTAVADLGRALELLGGKRDEISPGGVGADHRDPAPGID